MSAHDPTARVGAGAHKPRVAIAHDFMETYGGAERITAEIARAFSGAPGVASAYAPGRSAWSVRGDARARGSDDGLSRLACEASGTAMRVSDRRSSRSVARYLAPGGYVAEQLRRFYGRESEIIGAPVD